MKKIGLIGCGKVADYGHCPAIKKVDGFNLHALLDPDVKNLELMQKKFNVPHVFTKADDFFSSGLDAVTITSPAPFHLANVTDAARFKKDVLCEKPLAMTDEETTRMMEIAQKAGIRLYTGFTYRFSPAAIKIRELIQEKAIGETKSLRLIYIWNMHGKYETLPDGSRVSNPRRDGRFAEGGPMVDCGVHQIDLARWWLDSEVEQFGGYGAWADEYDAPDHVYLHMDHTCGAHAMIEMSNSYCHTAKEPVAHFTYQVIGTDGLIRYDREQHIFEMRNSKGTYKFDFPDEKNFKGMYESFLNVLETGKEGLLATARDGYAATHIARSVTDTIIGNRIRK